MHCELLIIENRFSQLSDGLANRTLNELVVMLRKLKLKEEEVVPLKAVIILNPSMNLILWFLIQFIALLLLDRFSIF